MSSVLRFSIAFQDQFREAWSTSGGTMAYTWVRSFLQENKLLPCRTVRLFVPDQDNRDRMACRRQAALDAIASGPSGGSQVITQGSAATPPREEEQPPGSSESDPVPRGFRVTKDLLDKFDFSKGCPKCEALRRGDNKQTVHHSKECRKRIE